LQVLNLSEHSVRGACQRKLLISLFQRTTAPYIHMQLKLETKPWFPFRIGAIMIFLSQRHRRSKT